MREIIGIVITLQVRIESTEVMSGRMEIIDQLQSGWTLQIKDLGTWVGFWMIDDLVSNHVKVNKVEEVIDQPNRVSRKMKLRRV